MKIITIIPEIKDADAVLHKFGRRSLRTPISAEMIHLPYLLFRYRIAWTTLGGKARTTDGLLCADLLQGRPMSIARATRFALEDGLEGEFAEFEPLLDPPRPKRSVTVERRDVPDAAVLPGALAEEDAIERSKAVLKYDLMRLFGGLRFRRIEIRPLPARKVLYYPFWLIYHRDRQGRMQFEAFDALSGQREKGDIARSIKLGLLKKSGKI